MGRKSPYIPQGPTGPRIHFNCQVQAWFPRRPSKAGPEQGWAKQNWQVGVGVGVVVLDTPTPGHKTPLASGVDGDDFTATSTHQQHPFKALS